VLVKKRGHPRQFTDAELMIDSTIGYNDGVGGACRPSSLAGGCAEAGTSVPVSAVGRRWAAEIAGIRGILPVVLRTHLAGVTKMAYRKFLILLQNLARN
jgi:hypothetical protein